MIDWNMTYNSAKDNLTIPEYGRHVQLLVDHARTLEDDALRQRFAERIIKLMMQMVPQNRNIEDYKGKLWRHLFRIAENDLRVSPPEGVEMPEDVSGRLSPDTVPYPESEAQYRHYGHNVQTMIKKAIGMEEGPKKDGYVAAIAAYMKLAYKTWNREHYVSDEVIKADLKSLSKGLLEISEEQSLDNLVNKTTQRRRPSNSSGSKGGKRSSGYSNRNNGGGRRKNSGGGRRGYRK
ncbi:MAG: DUF4290 domain-containing protein [Lewinella sp.]|jgi:hypothetical protein|uniref:DUF4290 domain-containing protein n=1 Tax=Lewinella sp. TaxID=2004506 RepID=UPI003D6A5526